MWRYENSFCCFLRPISSLYTSGFKTVVFFNINICCFIILNGILAAYGAICNNGPVMADNLNLNMTLPPSVIFWDINFAGKTWSRTSVSVSVSNLVRICSKWQNYRRITDFKMAASAILDFCICKFLWQMWLWDAVFRLSIKFGANMCNNGRVMAKNVIFNMAAAAILDFVGYEFWG